MKVLEPGHVYQLAQLDGQQEHDTLVFVNREPGRTWPGTQTQEVLRALIDRVQHCDRRVPCQENQEILRHLRMALLLHEFRALRRKFEKGELLPEEIVTNEGDGHFLVGTLANFQAAARQLVRAEQEEQDRLDEEANTIHARCANVTAGFGDLGDSPLKA